MEHLLIAVTHDRRECGEAWTPTADYFSQFETAIWTQAHNVEITEATECCKPCSEEENGGDFNQDLPHTHSSARPFCHFAGQGCPNFDDKCPKADLVSIKSGDHTGGLPVITGRFGLRNLFSIVDLCGIPVPNRMFNDVASFSVLRHTGRKETRWFKRCTRSDGLKLEADDNLPNAKVFSGKPTGRIASVSRTFC
jgi:hypothetical protein